MYSEMPQSKRITASKWVCRNKTHPRKTVTHGNWSCGL